MVIYNFEAQTPTLIQLTTKFGIDKIFNYYIMIAIPPTKVKTCVNYFNFKKALICLERCSFTSFRVTMCHEWHMWHFLSNAALCVIP
jgi:hypothetical protein